MTYKETLEYLYESVPMFQQIGKEGYKEGLENTLALDEALKHPHTHYKTIHIAGTNGKGSCSHTLAAILQSAGYKTGLYTSPHMKDFRERIRVNGMPVDEDYVVRFVENYRPYFQTLLPTFFELTTAMAFNYFREQQVDIAIIEVGMGGRLDCTNIIAPILSVITNISFDHTQYLGDTEEKIAAEKAGIIKQATPIIIGEATPSTKPVFLKKAKESQAPILFAEEEQLLLSHHQDSAEGGWNYQTADYAELRGELGGIYQIKNTNTVLAALRELTKQGINLPHAAVRNGFAHVSTLTGLMGRWQKLGEHPTVICDTGHNRSGIEHIVNQLKTLNYNKLHIVFGMVADKDINAVLALLPKEAVYYFTNAQIKRALPAGELQKAGATHGLKGASYANVTDALNAAKEKAADNDLIFVGGSTFVVADLLEGIG